MFFTKSDAKSCEALMEILHSYGAASGQVINTNKSSISFSGKTPQEVRIRVKDQLKIEKEGGVGKYLGLPEHFGRKKKDLFASIVDRMKQKAMSWNSRFLSTAGKVTMLQSVLSPIPNFAMTCFRLPVSLCNQIQYVLTRFLWDAKEGDNKISWVAWDTLTLPKDQGGLGFKDVQLFNQALLAKIAWRLITKPNCLLARVLIGKYCIKAPFLKIAPAPSSSHGWKGILWGRDLLLSHLGKAIGDGESTRVWSDSCIKPALDIMPSGPIQLQDQDLLVADLLSRETKEWNKQKVENTLPLLAEQIYAIKPSTLGASDAFIWSQTPSGTYSTKSGYHTGRCSDLHSTPQLMDNNTQGNRIDTGTVNSTWNWKKSIWSPPLLPKLKIFLWKCARNALPTKDNLVRRNVTTDSSCL